MAKQTSVSRTMAKMKKRAKGAWDRSRKKAARAKGAQLPDGIVRGVAQFTDYKLAEDKKGNPYVILQGTVKEPEDCDGLTAQRAHFIRETERKTVEDKLDDLSSDLQLLGGYVERDGESHLLSEDPEAIDLDDIPEVLENLKRDRPFFLFNTWKPADGDTMVFIQGLAEDFEPDEDVEVEDEDPEPEVEEDEEPEAEEPEAEEDEPAAFAEGDRVTVDGDWPGTVDWVEGDLAGVTADEDGETYEADLDSLQPLEEEGGDDEEPPFEDEEADGEDEEWEGPEEGDVFLYQASPRGKAKEVVVLAVDADGQTVDLKREEDGKTFKKIPWDKLQGAE